MPQNSDNIKQETPFWFTYGTLGLIFMFVGIIGAIFFKPAEGYTASQTVSAVRHGTIRIDAETSRYILKCGIPFLDRNAGEEDPFTLLNINWSDIYWKLAANIKNTSPLQIMEAQFPFIALYQPKPAEIVPRRDLQEPGTLPNTENSEGQDIVPELPGNPAILIYHTHTTESYIPVSGKERTSNSPGDIVKVGAYLQQVLADKYHLQSVHCETVHDIYPFRESYLRSQVSLKKYLTEYPGLKVVLDIHRDGTPDIESSCIVKGEKMAKLMIVVGSDKMGLPHPRWRKNLHFAKELVDAMNLYYPGLSRGIVTSEARYNQHLHDHALIIEVGDQNSTLEETDRAIDCFSDVLVKVLNKEAQGNSPEVSEKAENKQE